MNQTGHRIMSDPTVEELLNAIRSALSSVEGLNHLHRLGARHEAAVHAGIDRRLAALDASVE